MNTASAFVIFALWVFTFCVGKKISEYFHTRVSSTNMYSIISLGIIVIAFGVEMHIHSDLDVFYLALCDIIALLLFVKGLYYGKNKSIYINELIERYCHLRKAQVGSTGKVGGVDIDIDKIFGGEEE